MKEKEVMKSYKFRIVNEYKKIPSTPLDWGDVGDIAITYVGEPENGMVPAYGWLSHSGVTVKVEMLWAPGDFPNEYWIYGKEINKNNFIAYYKDAIDQNKPFPFYLEYIAPVDGAIAYIHQDDIEDETIEGFIEEYGDKDNTFYELCEFLRKELSKWKKSRPG